MVFASEIRGVFINKVCVLHSVCCSLRKVSAFIGRWWFDFRQQPCNPEECKHIVPTKQLKKKREERARARGAQPHENGRVLLLRLEAASEKTCPRLPATPLPVVNDLQGHHARSLDCGGLPATSTCTFCCLTRTPSTLHRPGIRARGAWSSKQ